jgi:acetamidase/formamidase
MSVALRFRLHKGWSILRPEYSLPQGVAPESDAKGYYVTTGISDDLMEAARSIVRHTADRYALDPYEAYALVSVAVDLRITEIVDVPNWVVSAFLPLSIVEDLGNR